MLYGLDVYLMTKQRLIKYESSEDYNNEFIVSANKMN